MTAPYHDKVIEADASIATNVANAAVATKVANASVAAKTADGELGPYGDSPVDQSWWRDAGQRPIRDANGNSIRVRIP